MMRVGFLPAMEAGRDVLRHRIRNIALAGRLRVSEGRALSLIQSVGTGTVLTLLSESDERRDQGLSTQAREMVIATLTGEPTAPFFDDHRRAATAMGAHLDRTAVLSAGERQLIHELLERIAKDGN